MNLARLTQILLPAIVLAATTVPAPAADVLSDQILPDGTYLYFNVANIEQAKKEFMESSFGQMIQDPAMDDFKAEIEQAFGSKMEEGLSQVEDALGLTVAEILAIPTGEVSFSITSSGNRLGAVVYIDFGDSESEIRSLLDQAAEKLNDVPELNPTSEEFDGTEVTIYEVDGPVPSPVMKEFGWFIRDSRLVICNSQRIMEDLIANWNGDSSDTLINQETYSYILSKCQSSERSATSTFYIDPIGLMTKIIQTGSLGQQGAMASMALGFFPTLGVDQIKGIGMVSEVGAGEFETVTRSMFYSEQPPRGLMRAMTLAPVDKNPPSWIKDDVIMYTSLNWKADEALNAVEELYDTFSGPGQLAALIDQAAESDPGIHIREDVVEQLNGDILVASLPTERTATTPGGNMIVAVGVRSPETVGDLLARLTDQANFPGSVREFQGSTLYEIEIPEADSVIGVTVVHGHLIIGMGDNVLESVVRNDSDIRPLSESEEFQQVAQHFPSGDVVTVTFSRPAEQYRSFYGMLISGEAAAQMQGMDEIFDAIDFSTLPPFETISKYIQPAGGFTTLDDDGFLTEAFYLKP